MRIGIVCYPTYGGSGVVATELGIGLADKGHHIHFISSAQPARLPSFHDRIEFHEVNLANYPLFEYAPYETALASKIVAACKTQKLDLLHVHYAVPHATSAFLARNILKEQGYYLPVITTLHGTDITLVGKDEAYAPVVEFSINQSDGITTVSESLKQDTLNNFKISKEIEVIPNFINLEAFKFQDKNHFKKAIAPNDEKLLVHVSNFRKVKRVEDVIRIFHRVSEVVPSKLILVGDGPERKNAEKLCRELDSCGEIRFLGNQDAVTEILSVSDLFLLPSEKESFGLSALEAMSVGVPVISSNTGGIPEVNIDGETGYLSNVGDVDNMAKQAIHLLSQPEKLASFRDNAMKRAALFDIHKILPVYEAFYEKVASSVNA